ncbi:MAG: D-3-phosphoglycerate dehydrogenase / 2-oxoglutarate reductase [Caldanaerobacter sp.]|nr:D-3-phosphoglycerate dehydrogenase / 2-oxoglutarate reductase [Caldanaerobacter sp.]
MSKYKIFMTDTIFPDTKIEEEVLSTIGAKLVLASKKDEKTFIDEGHDCDAMIVVYAPINCEVLSHLEKCKVIVRTGIGVDNIDLKAASNRGIMVANVPDYCIDEVADHTVALFLCGIRKIAFLNQRVKSGVWNVNEARPIPRLRGKKYGVLGCGAIGQQVAVRMSSFGMDVYGYDPYLPDEKFTELSITKVDSLEEFFSTVDFFSLHVPLTEHTRHIINKQTISLMKESVFFVNTSRGGLVNEEDLLEALSKKRIAGAALDVLGKEPPELTGALFKLDNLIVTPHAAFMSEDAMIELRRKAAEEVVRALTEGRPKYWVNRT